MWFFSGKKRPTVPAATATFDFTTGLPQGLTLSRSAAALGRDQTGRWVSFAANVMRTWYYPATLDGPYGLIEPERTQLMFRTRFPTPTATASTVTTDSAVATPFGAGAIKVVPNTTSTTHGWNLFFGSAGHAATLADNTTLALQIVMKPTGAYNNITFFLLGRNNVYSTVQVALQGNGSVVASSGVISAEISPDTDGFYTVAIVNNYNAGTTTPSFNANIHNDAAARTYAGDGTTGIWVAYVGAETGTEVTSPIVNSGVTTLTRPEDILASDLAWLAAGGKAFGIDYRPRSRSVQTVFQISGADVTELENGTASVTFSALVGGVSSATLTGSAPAPEQRRTVVVSAGTNNFVLAQDGVELDTDSLGPVPSAFSGFRIGARTSGAQPGPLLLKMLKYWNTILSPIAARSYSRDLTQDGVVIPLPVLNVQSNITLQPDENVLNLLVVLSGESSGATVGYRTVDGTARAGVDYVGSSGIVSIDVGQTSATITVGLNTRGTVADRTFRVELTGPTGARIGTGACDVLLVRVIPAGVPSSTQINFGATLPTNMTLTRTSAAWTRNSAGLWVQVAANGYRQHFTASGISGLLIEGKSTEQRLFDSVDPGFTANSGTRTLNTTGQTPTGTRWLQFREADPAAEHNMVVTLTGTNSAMPTGDFTTSVMIRPVNQRYFRLTVKGIDNVITVVHADLFGAGSVTAAGTGIIPLLERDPFDGTWYRVGLSRGQTATANVSAQITVGTQNELQNPNIDGNTINGFDLCHVQVSPEIGLTSPIIVTAASALTTRAADVVKASGTWFQLSTYTLGVRFIRLSDQPTMQRIWMSRDAANGANGISVSTGVVMSDTQGTVPVGAVALTGDGSRTAWTISEINADAPSSIAVAVDGALQSPGSYTLAGQLLTMSEPPPRNSAVDVRIFGGTMNSNSFVGTGVQTTWTLGVTVTGGSLSLLVSIDGVLQPVDSYSVLGTQVTFSEAPPLNSLVDVRVVSS